MTLAGKIGSFAAAAAGAFLIGWGAYVFFRSSATDQLSAIASVIGGLIGAAGAAFAVYLTLVGQREDEAEKVEAALRAEVAEFGRLAIGALQIVESVLSGQQKIPVRDLPMLIKMPDAVVYKATADRISRLKYGSLFVVFHARIAEIMQLVSIYAISKPVRSARARLAEVMEQIEENRQLDKEKATTLASAWIDVCEIAQLILNRRAESALLAEAVVADVMKDIDAVTSRVLPLVGKTSASK